MLEAIQNAYAFFDQLQLSVTGLVVAMIAFAVAFLFAIREAASWFFKVDDLKRDIARLREISLQLEAEVKLIQSLVSQAAQSLPPPTGQPRAAESTEPLVASTLVASTLAAESLATELRAEKEKAGAKSAGSFPIVH